MDFLELAKRRHSSRAYDARPVEREKVDRIVEAAHVAPTASNRQPVRLAVVEGAEALARLGAAGNLHGAPLAIVVCADHGRSWKRSFDGLDAALIDASILADHMMMEATDLGLGTCWICAFDPAVASRALELPATLEPVSILAAGYAADAPADPERHAETRIPVRELVLVRG